MPRLLKSDHVRIGHVAKSESKNSAWKKINALSVYPANGKYGEKIVGITASHEPGTAPVLYLNPAGIIEVVKGLLQHLVSESAITMVADDEFRAILEQVKATIKTGDEDAEAVVRAVTGE